MIKIALVTKTVKDAHSSGFALQAKRLSCFLARKRVNLANREGCFDYRGDCMHCIADTVVEFMLL